MATVNGDIRSVTVLTEFDSVDEHVAWADKVNQCRAQQEPTYDKILPDKAGREDYSVPDKAGRERINAVMLDAAACLVTSLKQVRRVPGT